MPGGSLRCPLLMGGRNIRSTEQLTLVRQEIPNSQNRHKGNLITPLRKQLDKLLRKFVKTPESNKNDGTSRRHSRRQRLLENIQQQETIIEQVRAQKMERSVIKKLLLLLSFIGKWKPLSLVHSV